MDTNSPQENVPLVVALPENNNTITRYGITFIDKKQIDNPKQPFNICSYWVNKNMNSTYKYCNSICFYRTNMWEKYDYEKYFVNGITKTVEQFQDTMSLYFERDKWFIRIYIDNSFAKDIKSRYPHIFVNNQEIIQFFLKLETIEYVQLCYVEFNTDLLKIQKYNHNLMMFSRFFVLNDLTKIGIQYTIIRNARNPISDIDCYWLHKWITENSSRSLMLYSNPEYAGIGYTKRISGNEITIGYNDYKLFYGGLWGIKYSDDIQNLKSLLMTQIIDQMTMKPYDYGSNEAVLTDSIGYLLQNTEISNKNIFNVYCGYDTIYDFLNRISEGIYSDKKTDPIRVRMDSSNRQKYHRKHIMKIRSENENENENENEIIYSKEDFKNLNSSIGFLDQLIKYTKHPMLLMVHNSKIFNRILDLLVNYILYILNTYITNIYTNFWITYFDYRKNKLPKNNTLLSSILTNYKMLVPLKLLPKDIIDNWNYEIIKPENINIDNYIKAFEDNFDEDIIYEYITGRKARYVNIEPFFNDDIKSEIKIMIDRYFKSIESNNIPNVERTVRPNVNSGGYKIQNNRGLKKKKKLRKVKKSKSLRKNKRKSLRKNKRKSLRKNKRKSLRKNKQHN